METANVIEKPSAEMSITDLAFPICQKCKMFSSIVMHCTGVPTVEVNSQRQGEGEADNGGVVSHSSMKLDELMGNRRTVLLGIIWKMCRMHHEKLPLSYSGMEDVGGGSTRTCNEQTVHAFVLFTQRPARET